MIKQIPVPEALLDSYKKEDTEARSRRYIIACWLSLGGTASGIPLDAVMYPDSFMKLLTVRSCALLAIGFLLLLHRVRIGRENIVQLGLSWALTVNLSISAMVFFTNGTSSPYYAGLNLVILAAGVLLPWTFRETLLVCIATLVIYLYACFLWSIYSNEPLDLSLLFSNCFFVFLTGLISTTSSFFTTNARISDFILRSELDNRNKKLEELDRMKSRFFANVSHELRTPLTLILSPLQDLLQVPGQLSDRMSSLLRTARDNSFRLLKLVNDLLEVVRLEEGKSNLSLEPLDLSSYLRGITDSMHHLAEARKIAFSKKLADTPTTINADSYALERIFLNLLSNAIKFTPEGGSVIVSCKAEDEKAVVEISDTGIGIEKQDLEYIFDRFRQVDSSNTRKYQGSGLGLALVKDLTEKMGGTIEAQSEPGVGTTMTLSIPLAKSEETGEQVEFAKDMSDPLEKLNQAAEHRATLPISSPFEADESKVTSGTGPILLIVDDEPDMRQYLVNTLESEYRIAQARDGAKALELARKHKPDLMLLDLMLPEIDGLEVCKRLKDDPDTRNIKIVLLTARIDEGAKINALENGADDFLTKPFSRTEVETRLRNLLANAQLESDLRDRNASLETALADLREAQTSLVQSEKLNALGSLAAGLLHEVNNPLNYVITALQLVKQEPQIKDNAEIGEFFEDIDEGVERIRHIVSDLHAFAHPTELDKQQVFAIADAAETAVRFTAHDCRGIEIEQGLDPSHRMLGSQGHIVQVLVNLLSNACRAVNAVDEERDGRIAIRSEKHKDRISVFVRDNGVGMSDEIRQRVFDPFFTTRDVGQGMGLGLSVCHTIIKNHGGELAVKSEEGQGAEFRFDLPAAPVASNEEERLLENTNP